ncbi:MAG: hypothetical protein K2X11_14815 [Acetobacteraceae bacterium]|nr:hypothetical protein [Acetobacteraceae bacterium]
MTRQAFWGAALALAAAGPAAAQTDVTGRCPQGFLVARVTPQPQSGGRFLYLVTFRNGSTLPVSLRLVNAGRQTSLPGGRFEGSQTPQPVGARGEATLAALSTSGSVGEPLIRAALTYACG